MQELKSMALLQEEGLVVRYKIQKQQMWTTCNAAHYDPYHRHRLFYCDRVSGVTWSWATAVGRKV